ncbi:hypothetical protein RUM44_010138 [Polyplax serrata]|uniref:Uncharacterized protein n=1 Tax=Polyplax serrata TaxID=468196 RepID=A0ABR1AUP5_POLSC
MVAVFVTRPVVLLGGCRGMKCRRRERERERERKADERDKPGSYCKKGGPRSSSRRLQTKPSKMPVRKHEVEIQDMENTEQRAGEKSEAEETCQMINHTE